jgi:hypothetical protein
MAANVDLERLGLPATRIESCDRVACEVLVDPIPRPRPEPFTVRLQPAEPRVVLVDNGKPNSLTILRDAQALLRERGVAVADEIPGKPSAGIPMEPDLLEALAGARGLVLLGVND